MIEITELPHVVAANAQDSLACVDAVQAVLGSVYAPAVGALVANVAEDFNASWPIVLSVIGADGQGLKVEFSRNDEGNVKAKAFALRKTP
jgi:hypothetical protein